jgi:oxygen-dependent protoporphyrinogen oxidase
MNSVAVVGGGITGLTAAFYLTRGGIPVTLYEKTDRVGGAIRSTLDQGFLAEDGPSQITETPEVAALVEDLQLEARRLYPSPEAKARFIVKHGQLMEVPASPLGLLGTKLFSGSAKLRLLAEPFIKRGDAASDESVADFVRRRLGRELLDYAVDPLISGIYAGDPSRLSLRSAFPKLRELEQTGGSLTAGALGLLFKGNNRGYHKDQQLAAAPKKKNARGRVLFSFDAGCQVLPDTLAGRLGSSIRLSTPITGIARTDRGWNVTVMAGDREETNSHSAVLLAAPAHELGSLANGARGSVSFAPLNEIIYPPIARVTLGFREDQFPAPIRGFGFLVPSKERFRILGTVFASCVYPGRAPQDCVNLSSYLGGLRNPGITARSSSELFAATLGDYRTLLGVKGEPVFASQTVIQRAIPQYTIGYERYRQWIADSELSAPGLFFAGNYRDGISVADSIGSGVKGAMRLAAFLNG